MKYFKKKQLKITLTVLFTVILIVAGALLWRFKNAPTAGASWWNDNWSYRKAIVINHNYVEADLVNFPVLISLTDSNLGTHAQEDGDDIIFISQIGRRLSHEIESFSTSTGALVAWVKIPSLSSADDTLIYMYYGNAGVGDQSDAENVWDENYVGVWHLNEATSTVRYDSTRNNNDLTDYNSVGQGNGKMGKAADLEAGNSEYLRREESLLNGLNINGADQPITISAWVWRESDTGNYESVAAMWEYGLNERQYFMGVDINDDPIMRLSYDGTSYGETTGAVNVSTGAWHYLAAGYDDTYLAIMLDGQFDLDGDNPASYSSGINNSASPFSIGCYFNSDSSIRHFDGRIDEVRVANIARSVEWAETEYNNQNSPATFLAEQAEETGPGPVGYWSFDTGHGTTAYDESGQGNDGTITDATWQDESMCVSGKCLWFDGSDDYISVVDESSLNPGNITISAWIKTSVLGRYIIAKDPVNEIAQSQGIGKQAGQLIHFRWDASGRTFKAANPGQYVYKAKLGQRNVKLTNGTYVPYLWDEKNKILKFADNSIHFKGKEWEFWHENEKVHQIAFYPEVKNNGEWQKEIASISDFKIKEIKTTSPTDYIEISYNLETSNQKSTIALKAGGSASTQFSFDTEAKKAGEYRLAVEQDNMGLEPIYANSNIRIPENKNSEDPVLLGYRHPETGFYWHWLEDEVGHYIEEKESNKLALLLNEDKYRAGEIKGVYPDTWGTDVGITANGDDGHEHSTDGWSADGSYGGYNFMNCEYSGNTNDIGLRWTGLSTIAQGSTIINATLDVYGDGYISGTPTGYWYCADEANMPQWSESVVPSNRTKTSASVFWAPTTIGEWHHIVVTPLVQEIITSYTTDNIGFFTDEIDEYNTWVAIQDYCHAGTNEPELTITYTSKTDIPYVLDITANGKGRVMFIRDSINYSAISTTVINDNSWHYVSGTYDGDDLRLYIDGFLEGINSDPSGDLPIATGSVRIGADYDNPVANFFAGFIDEAKIYPYARSADEIKQDYTAGLAGIGTSKGVSAAFGYESEKWMTDGLVGYWKMDSSVGTWNGTTNEVVDSSGNGNHGFASGTPGSLASTTAGKFGNGGVFDGSNDQIIVLYDPILNITGDITFTAWVKGIQGTIISKDDGNNGYDANEWNYDFWIDNGKISFYSDASGFNPYLESNTTFTADNWHHVVFTRNGSNITYYLDGAEDGTHVNGNTFPDNSYDLHIGDCHHSENSLFDGLIDEVRIYNRALSPREVRKLYEWAPGPVAHWKMDEHVRGDGQTIYDSAASTTYSGGNHGTTVDGANNTGMDCTKPGKYGTACKFDGVDDYINLGNTTTFIYQNSPFTISAWAYLDAYTDIYPFIVQFKTDLSQPYTVWFSNQTSYKGIAIGERDTFARLKTDTDPDSLLDRWIHVAVTYNGSGAGTAANFKAYIDSVEQTLTSAGAWGSGTHVSAIGDMVGNGYGEWNGLIDDVRIYNYVRTQKQIIEDMNVGHPAGGSPIGSETGYWKFDEGYGITAYDESQYNNDGTLTCTGPGCDIPVWTLEGKFNRAMEFDGDDDLVDCGDNASIQLDSEDWAVSLWAKSYSIPGGNSYSLIEKQDEYLLNIKSDGILYWKTGVSDSGDPVISWTTDQWYHLVGIYDYNPFSPANSHDYLYINGELKGDSSEGDISGTANTLVIGADSGSYGSYVFDGLIDDVRIYNFALNEDEIKLIYNQGKSAVMGAVSTATTTAGVHVPSNAASRAYCVPGSDDYCAAPVLELKMDEKQGTTTYDTSGQGNDGVFVTSASSPSWKGSGYCQYGNCLDFDGSDDYANVVDSSSFDLSGDFSISAYFKLDNDFDSTTVDTQLILGKHEDNNQNLYLGLQGTDSSQSSSYDGKLYLKFEDRTGGTYYLYTYTNKDSWTANKWYHVTAVWDDEVSGSTPDIYVYINGVDVSDDTSGTPDSAQNLYNVVGNIGVGGGITCEQSGETEYFAGLLDQVRFYDYARTPAQAAWEYNWGKPIAHWKFDECSGGTIYDESGNGNNGILQIGTGGTNTATGTCASSSASSFWYNGRNGHLNSCGSFDGTDDYVIISDSDLADGFPGKSSTGHDKTMTVSAWVKFDDLPSTEGEDGDIVDKYETTTGDRSFRLLVIDSTDRPYFGVVPDGQTLDWAIGATSLQADTWYHLTGVYTGSDLRMYVNGFLDENGSDNPKTYSGGIHLGADNFSIGARTNALSRLVDGLIDEVKIWNYALTEEQIKAEYAGGAVRFGE